MKKPSVYLDTTIVSAYCYVGKDRLGIVRRGQTRDWWRHEKQHFEVWTSAVAERELSDGKFAGQKSAVSMVRRLRYAPLSDDVLHLAAQFAEAGVVPASKPGDGLQIALAVAHEIDYLLSWNYAHLANPDVQRQLDRQCRRQQRRCPLLVTPESIPQIRFGSDPRR